MKNIYSLSICFLMGLGTLISQNVLEQENTMSLGSHYSFYVEIDGASKKMVEKQWKAYMKSYGKTKYNRKAKEYYTNSAKIPVINGTNKMDFYTKIDEGKDLTTLYAWIDLGGSFAEPADHRMQVEGIRTFLSDFWITSAKEVIGKELKAEEKNQSGLEKDLARLEKNNDTYHNNIEKLRQRISELESKIEQNYIDQDDKRVEIKQQSKVVDEVVVKLNSIGKAEN